MPPAAPRPTRIVRPCFQQDLELVQLIYAHHVMTGTGSFEYQPPDLDEMTARWSRIVTNGWPFLVAAPTADLSRVLGFAYAAPFRDRPGYTRTFEDAVYVAPNMQGAGIGKLLLGELLSQLMSDGVREVLAVIGDSRNTASVALHARAGFRHIGVMNMVGRKFDRWLDVVLMQRSLRVADDT
jgi:L-amino acid N-acyltransferase YncA